jgi:hypothetical protein
MNVQVQPHVTTTRRHLPFECVALVLQSGGALGAYQAGVYEALAIRALPTSRRVLRIAVFRSNLTARRAPAPPH